MLRLRAWARVEVPVATVGEPTSTSSRRGAAVGGTGLRDARRNVMPPDPATLLAAASPSDSRDSSDMDAARGDTVDSDRWMRMGGGGPSAGAGWKPLTTGARLSASSPHAVETTACCEPRAVVVPVGGPGRVLASPPSVSPPVRPACAGADGGVATQDGDAGMEVAGCSVISSDPPVAPHTGEWQFTDGGGGDGETAAHTGAEVHEPMTAGGGGGG
jgi:hypothetical protein